MGGVQSGTHNLGDALWVQERQKQKGQRDTSKYDTNGQSAISSQSQTSTQERRKLLKRTRSLAVITEDESNRGATVALTSTTTTTATTTTITTTGGSGVGCYTPIDEVVLGSRLGISYDTSSLPHHHHHHHHRRPSSTSHHHLQQQQQQQQQQLIPRAKLIDRNSLKDRLSKSQQHLTDYSYYNDHFGDLRACQSRSVCGIYQSLPPPLDSLPDPLPYTRAGGLYRGSATLRPDHHRINILKWPDNEISPRRYRSVQDLNSEFVDGFIEDSYRGWSTEGGFVDEENRSLDCIYTQVKRKRKEHRSLDSILFEDDSDELEYFDVLNLLPLSNVRLEINDDSDDRALNGGNNDNVIQKRNLAYRDHSKSSPTIISVSAKRTNTKQQHYTGAQITEIEDNSIEERNNTNTLVNKSKEDSIKDDVTSFGKLAKEKRASDKIGSSNFEELKRKENRQTKDYFESCSRARKQLQKNKEDVSKRQEEEFNSQGNGNKEVEETEDTKSLWISDNEELTEDMSRRPMVFRVVDNEGVKKNNLDIKSNGIKMKSNNDEAGKKKKSTCENGTVIYRTGGLNKPDLLNDHNHEAKNNNAENGESEKENNNKFSVRNAKNFFEKKTNDDNGEDKTRSVKGSLGYEARSESSDLGIGSEVGSDVRRLSVDENTKRSPDHCNNNNNNQRQYDELVDEKNQKNNYTNLMRSRSYVDSIECQDPEDGAEFDHVRYKILKSHMFSKNIFNNAKNDVTYEGLMQYLREYSFQDLLLDNNVVIIEPVRAEVDRKPSFNNDSKLKSIPSYRLSSVSPDKTKSPTTDTNSSSDEKSEQSNHFKKTSRQSSLRKHFFYQPIRVNRELNHEELPGPDTVKNVRMMFEETMRKKSKSSLDSKISRDCDTRKSVSMKDLRMIYSCSNGGGAEKTTEASRSRCSSRAKDLTRMFENLDKSTSLPLSSIVNNGHSEHHPPMRSESKARAIAQSFEVRSGQSSPSNSNSSKARRANRYHQQRQFHNWDAGSISSGVSSDYPDTDAGSAPACTSSEDEELYYHEDDEERYESHYVPPDVLKKIREYGTSVTYYGGKVLNVSNGPPICPKISKVVGKNTLDCIKFRLVKSNSCDSRLELTGRVIDIRNKYQSSSKGQDRGIDLRQFTIDETPSIEITTIERKDNDDNDDKSKENTETKEKERREPPVVIGLEPKKEEIAKGSFKANFQLGKLDDNATSVSRFTPSALSRWQINENAWKKNSDFGKMEFEEFEVLEDSLNEIGH